MMGEFPLGSFVTGGAVLAVVGYVLAVARSVPARVCGFVRRHLVTMVEVSHEDALFRWACAWLDAQGVGRRTTLLTASTHYGEVPLAVGEAGQERPRVVFSPAPGSHLFWWKGRLVLLTRERQERRGENGSPPLEYLRFFTLGRSQEAGRSILEAAVDLALPPGDKRVRLHVPGGHGGWSSREIAPRKLDSVVLPEGRAEGLLADVVRFRDGQEWYLKRGVPWRRGYLLYGPPGGGKSSLVHAVATELGWPLYSASLNALTTSALAELAVSVRGRSVLLLEDVDSDLTEDREVRREAGRGDGASSRASFSDVLNALDGVNAGEGRLLFLTTNHPDRLDPALTRPGRADVHIELGHATAELAGRMFERFFPGEDELRRRFAGRVGASSGTSMARVQEALVAAGDDPKVALVPFPLSMPSEVA